MKVLAFIPLLTVASAAVLRLDTTEKQINRRSPQDQGPPPNVQIGGLTSSGDVSYSPAPDGGNFGGNGGAFGPPPDVNNNPPPPQDNGPDPNQNPLDNNNNQPPPPDPNQGGSPFPGGPGNFGQNPGSFFPGQQQFGQQPFPQGPNFNGGGLGGSSINNPLMCYRYYSSPVGAIPPECRAFLRGGQPGQGPRVSTPF